jgi:ABC-type multidrug transport system ATPase subunit
MYEGKLVWQGSMADLRSGAIQTVRVQTDRPEDAARVLNGLGLTDVSTLAGSLVKGELGDVDVAAIVPRLVDAGVAVLGFSALAPSLEDLFVSLTGEGFDVSG